MCSTEQQRQFYAKHGDKWNEYTKKYRKTDEYKTYWRNYMKDYLAKQRKYNSIAKIFRNILI